jgi:hypothetical protein
MALNKLSPRMVAQQVEFGTCHWLAGCGRQNRCMTGILNNINLIGSCKQSFRVRPETVVIRKRKNLLYV